jgi:hypothetical protein
VTLLEAFTAGYRTAESFNDNASDEQIADEFADWLRREVPDGARGQ